MLRLKAEGCLSRLGGLFPSCGNSFVPMKPEQLAAVEHRLGHWLPEDYKAFASIYGNSRFDHLVGQRVSPGRTVFVSSFYGGDGELDDACKISWAIRVYEGRMPATVIPIAECAEQGEICLGVSGLEAEKVYFWDRSQEWAALEEECLREGRVFPPETRFQNMTKLADSFEGFLCGLEIIDE